MTGRDARVSVQATRKREGRSHSSSAHNGQHFHDPSPPAAGEFAPRRQHPIFAGKGEERHKTSVSGLHRLTGSESTLLIE